MLNVLEAYLVRFLLVGGHAVKAYGSTRPTKDVDVLIDNSPENSERFVAAMVSLNIRHPNLSADNIAGQKRQINFATWGYDFEVLTAADGLTFDEAYARRVATHYGGVTLPVIAKADLITMKLRAGRLIDLNDLEYLRGAA